MTDSEPFVLDVALDRSSTTPLHAQIAEPLARRIESGELAAGTRLENEVAMAQRLDVSRPTARRALESLAHRGLIVRRRGAGTRVTPAPLHRAMSLGSLHDDLAESGREPRTSVLEWRLEQAPPGVARAMDIRVDADVVLVRRLRMVRDDPLAILTNWLPPDIAPTRAELAEHGLYDLLREREVMPAIGVQQVSARLATEAEARLLGEPAGAALLALQRTAYDSASNVIEFGQHVVRASMYSFSQVVFS
ncbi:MAG: GntR family transcriptional regulator [Actinomycetota bacterium]